MAEPFAAGVRLLILTAARRSEIFEASSDPSWCRRRIRLPAERSKTDEGRLIHLSPPALAIVEALPRFADSPWLLTLDGKHPFSNFGYGKAELDRRILEARRKAAGDDAKPMPAMADPRPAPQRGDRHAAAGRAPRGGRGRAGPRLRQPGRDRGRLPAAPVRQPRRARRWTLWGEHVMRLLDPTPAKVVPMRKRAVFSA